MGYFILILASICQGSFSLGYKHREPFSWAVYWGGYNVICLLISSAWAFFKEPTLLEIIASAAPRYFVIPILCGIAWGMSTIGYSKSILTVGMSLCVGISMGVSSAVGSVIPFLTGGQFSATSLLTLVVGVLITLAGIGLITKAGIDRDAGQKQGNAKTGVAFSVFAGIGAGMMNIGFNYAAPLCIGASNDAAAAIQWFPVLFGGCAAVVLYCVIEAVHGKTLDTFFATGATHRIGILFCTSTLWFVSLTLYGMASKMTGATSVCWLVFNALALIVCNFWGVKTGEWTGFPKEKRMMFLGDIVLAASWVVIAAV